MKPETEAVLLEIVNKIESKHSGTDVYAETDETLDGCTVVISIRHDSRMHRLIVSERKLLSARNAISDIVANADALLGDKRDAAKRLGGTHV